ncbi:Glycosyltransferase involved in cell wall bisynthesis [Flavobacteriaceae bacterium MAR_2010_188]|nr:Glycosyltransferase involved in cell wall bisynthesis [Flavobacteriaceae bacterium MAR_2010_188]
MKEIFIITSYYPPEIGAASNRIRHMAEGLQDLGYKITVVTPLPNYPTGKIFNEYKGKFISKSSHNNVNVIRLWIYASNSKNRIKRLLAMLSFSFSLITFYISHKIPKTVIVQSPPLLVAFTSMFLLRSKNRKLLLNISDLWPSAGVELGAISEGFGLKILKRIEKFNYKSAELILGQSLEILKHVKAMFPVKKTFLYRNYPVIEKSANNYTHNASAARKSIVYAGLLGIAQGVLELCKNLDFTNVDFHIYGDGAERKDLEIYIIQNPELPITYHGNVSREKLHDEITRYDFGIIPLKNRIYGSVPSKIFEYAFLGLPIIYFGGGEGEDIVDAYKLGFSVESGNFLELNKCIAQIKKDEYNLDYRNRIKESARSNFDHLNQIEELVKQL